MPTVRDFSPEPPTDWALHEARVTALRVAAKAAITRVLMADPSQGFQ